MRRFFHSPHAGGFISARRVAGGLDAPIRKAQPNAPFMDGSVWSADGKVIPGKDDPKAHEACPFAATAGFAPPVAFAHLVAPELSCQAAPPALAAAPRADAVRFSRYASRALSALN